MRHDPDGPELQKSPDDTSGDGDAVTPAETFGPVAVQALADETTSVSSGASSASASTDGHSEEMHAQVRAFLETAPPELSAWASATAAKLDVPADTPTAPESRRRRRVPTALLVVLLVPVIIWGVYKIGAPPAPEQTASGQAASIPPMSAEQNAPPLDTAAVAEMEARLEADPTDIAAMSELGRLHLMAGDFREAGLWQQRILADHPDDMDARLALGVALFNQGEAAPAQEQWERAAELDPTKAEPHYNLGFLHLSADPPDMDLVELHWNKVIELDPDSDMAETISAHMGGVEGLQPLPDDEP